jgi:NAD(P)-dependent dehydrogenase (short-subunit alcohol dehydrogenase family)
MKTAIILGSNSDIAKGLEPLLAKDYRILKWSRGSVLPLEDWDLVVCCIGTVAPVGLWHDVDEIDWIFGIESNLITPFRLLQSLWPTHNPGASVCFMAGSNPQMIMDGYSSYCVGKMGLLKLVEQLDHETPDAKFFALGPGTILTKIHQATTKARWDNPKLDAALANPGDMLEQIERVHDCLMWCVAQEKRVIGGRNICVSDAYGKALTESLWDDNWKYKLRRANESR